MWKADYREMGREGESQKRQERERGRGGERERQTEREGIFSICGAALLPTCLEGVELGQPESRKLELRPSLFPGWQLLKHMDHLAVCPGTWVASWPSSEEQELRQYPHECKYHNWWPHPVLLCCFVLLLTIYYPFISCEDQNATNYGEPNSNSPGRHIPPTSGCATSALPFLLSYSSPVSPSP